MVRTKGSYSNCLSLLLQCTSETSSGASSNKGEEKDTSAHKEICKIKEKWPKAPQMKFPSALIKMNRQFNQRGRKKHLSLPRNLQNHRKETCPKTAQMKMNQQKLQFLPGTLLKLKQQYSQFLPAALLKLNNNTGIKNES